RRLSYGVNGLFQTVVAFFQAQRLQITPVCRHGLPRRHSRVGRDQAAATPRQGGTARPSAGRGSISVPETADSPGQLPYQHPPRDAPESAFQPSAGDSIPPAQNGNRETGWLRLSVYPWRDRVSMPL